MFPFKDGVYMVAGEITQWLRVCLLSSTRSLQTSVIPVAENPIHTSDFPGTSHTRSAQMYVEAKYLIQIKSKKYFKKKKEWYKLAGMQRTRARKIDTHSVTKAL